MSAIERRAVEEFAQKIKDGVADYLYKTNFDGRKDNVIDMFELCEIVDKVLKEYEAGEIENAQTAAAEEEKGVVNDKPFIGKFKSVDAPYRAYERLEAEFTRRSQRLKALEAAAQRNTDENNLKIKIIIYRQGSIKPKSKNL